MTVVVVQTLCRFEILDTSDHLLDSLLIMFHWRRESPWLMAPAESQLTAAVDILPLASFPIRTFSQKPATLTTGHLNEYIDQSSPTH